MAIAALVLGILSILFGILFFPLGFLLAIIGLVLGVLALNRSRRSGGAGRGLAIGGIVTSVLGLLAAIAAATVLANVASQLFSDPEFQDALENPEELESFLEEEAEGGG